MILIGLFYIMTTFFGFGAASLLGPDHLKLHGGTNMAAPELARFLGGEIFFALSARSRSRRFLAVVAGPDDQREHELCARFLHERDPSRKGAPPG
jgi:cation/acetate symporter